VTHRDRNQLASCMLLAREENGPGGKCDKPPEVWFAGKPEAYLDMHLIPKERALWRLDRFEDFMAARQGLMRAKFAEWIVAPGKARAATP
jgi:hypothetical protein